MQQGGTALAELIFGDESPSGRVPLTWYPQAYITDGKDPKKGGYTLSAWDMSLRPNASSASTVREGRTYRCVRLVCFLSRSLLRARTGNGETRPKPVDCTFIT